MEDSCYNFREIRLLKLPLPPHCSVNLGELKEYLQAICRESDFAEVIKSITLLFFNKITYTEDRGKKNNKKTQQSLDPRLPPFMLVFKIASIFSSLDGEL